MVQDGRIPLKEDLIIRFKSDENDISASEEYKVVSIVGYGATGIVYKVKTKDNRVYAMKEIYPIGLCDRIGDGSIISIDDYSRIEFERILDNVKNIESKFANSFDGENTNIIQSELKDCIYIDGKCVNNYYLIMQKLNGMTVKEFLSDFRNEFNHLPPIKKTAEIIKVFLIALKEIVEEKHYLLRDIKADNLFMYGYKGADSKWYPFFIDYGSVIELDEEKDYKYTVEVDLSRPLSTKGYSPWELSKNALKARAEAKAKEKDNTEDVTNDSMFRLTPALDIYSMARVFLFLITNSEFLNNGNDMLVDYPDCNNEECIEVAIKSAKSRRKDVNCSEKAFETVKKILINSLNNNYEKRYKTIDLFIQDISELEKIAKYNYYFSAILPQRLKSKDFFGRTEELNIISDMLSEKNIAFISGIGGIGKTELAAQYSAKFQGTVIYEFYNPFYEESDNGKVNVGLRNLIMTLPISDAEIKPLAMDDKLNDYSNRLSILRNLCDEKILLIIDNFNTEDDIYLKDLMSLKCKIIFTTRNDYAKYGYNQLNLRELPVNDCINIYKNNCSDVNDDICEKIVKKLEFHTEAIILIARQQQYERISGTDMLSRLEKGLNEIGTSKISYKKNGQLYNQDNAYILIRKIFDMSSLETEDIVLLRNVSLFSNRGVQLKRLLELSNLNNMDAINKVLELKWLNRDEDIVYIKPIIKEVIFDCEDIGLDDYEIIIDKMFCVRKHNINLDEFYYQRTYDDKINLVKKLDFELEENDRRLIVASSLINAVNNDFYLEKNIDDNVTLDKWFEDWSVKIFKARRITKGLFSNSLIKINSSSYIKKIIHNIYKPIFTSIYTVFLSDYFFSLSDNEKKNRIVWFELQCSWLSSKMICKLNKLKGCEKIIDKFKSLCGAVIEEYVYSQSMETEDVFYHDFFVLEKNIFFEQNAFCCLKRIEMGMLFQQLIYVIFNNSRTLPFNKIKNIIIIIRPYIVRSMKYYEKLHSYEEALCLYLSERIYSGYNDLNFETIKGIIRKISHEDRTRLKCSIRILANYIIDYENSNAYKEKFVNEEIEYFLGTAIKWGDAEANYALAQYHYRKSGNKYSDEDCELLKKASCLGYLNGISMYIQVIINNIQDYSIIELLWWFVIDSYMTSELIKIRCCIFLINSLTNRIKYSELTYIKNIHYLMNLKEKWLKKIGDEKYKESYIINDNLQDNQKIMNVENSNQQDKTFRYYRIKTCGFNYYYLTLNSPMIKGMLDDLICYGLDYQMFYPKIDSKLKFIKYLSSVNTAVLINGYPSSTIEQIGVMDEEEAIEATQYAVWYLGRATGRSDTLKSPYIVDLDTLISTSKLDKNIANRFDRVKKAALNISDKALKNPYYANPKMNIEGEQEVIHIQDNYAIIGPYIIKANGFEISEIKVELYTDNKDSFLCDINGEQTDSFNNGDSVYIKIPKTNNKIVYKLYIHVKGIYYVGKIYGSGNKDDDIENFALLETQPVDIRQTIYSNSGDLTIFSIDENNLPIKDMTYQVLKNDGTIYVDSIATDSDGKAYIGCMAIGEYFFKEISVPKNIVPNNRERRFEIQKSMERVEYTIKSYYERGRLKIKCVDSQTGKNISGIEVTVYNSSGKELFVMITNDNGEAISKPLDYLRYKYKITKIPENYILDNEEYLCCPTENKKVIKKNFYL